MPAYSILCIPLRPHIRSLPQTDLSLAWLILKANYSFVKRKKKSLPYMLCPIPSLKNFCFNPTLNLKILFVPEYPWELRPLFPNLRNDALKNYNYKSKFCSFCFPFFLLKKGKQKSQYQLGSPWKAKVKIAVLSRAHWAVWVTSKVKVLIGIVISNLVFMVLQIF